MSEENKTISTIIATKEKLKFKNPSYIKIILLNDDYTPMEYVVKLLRIIFKKSEDEAVNIMLMVHKRFWYI